MKTLYKNPLFKNLRGGYLLQLLQCLYCNRKVLLWTVQGPEFGLKPRTQLQEKTSLNGRRWHDPMAGRSPPSASWVYGLGDLLILHPKP